MITVREMRALLEGLPDDLPVVVHVQLEWDEHLAEVDEYADAHDVVASPDGETAIVRM